MSDRVPTQSGDVAVVDSDAVDAAAETGASRATLDYALDRYVAAVQCKPLSPAYKRRIGESIEAFKPFRQFPAAESLGLARGVDPVEGLPRVLQDGLDRVRIDRLTPAGDAVDFATRRPGADVVADAFEPEAVDVSERDDAPVVFGRRRISQVGTQRRRVVTQRLVRLAVGDIKKAERLFAVGVTRLMTKPERDRHADGPDHLRIPELVALYRAIEPNNALHKIILLMGIFTAQGQSELSCAVRREFDLKRGRFTHRRNKTGQQGEYWLPPELVQLLKHYFERVSTDRDDTAFFTASGSRLVSETSDAVRQAFDDWRTRAKINRRGVSFYACRRLLGDLAKRAGGRELRAAALAHAGSDVGDRHYSNYRDFGKLQRVARKLYRDLNAAAMFARVSGGSKLEKVRRESARTN